MCIRDRCNGCRRCRGEAGAEACQGSRTAAQVRGARFQRRRHGDIRAYLGISSGKEGACETHRSWSRGPTRIPDVESIAVIDREFDADTWKHRMTDKISSSPPAGADIRLENVSIEFGGRPVVSNINLTVSAGEFVCLLGPSGCGKSTLLNLVAGFVPAATGRVTINGVPVVGPGMDRGVVFQSTEALFPWLTVQENVEYGPRMRGVGRSERAGAARHYLELVGLSHAGTKFPGELSGGMRQRAQIARVLINEPSVVLLDEPFGALDAQTREVMQAEIDRIWRATRPTILFITHDIWEAILLGDRVITMTAGPEAKLKTIAPIMLPHPRELASEKALELFRELREDIAEEVRRTLQAQGLARAVAA